MFYIVNVLASVACWNALRCKISAPVGLSPTQIEATLPMVVMKRSATMTTATRQRTRIDRLHDGAWLYRLLADIRKEVGEQPSPVAVARIRSRLLAEMKAPEKAAA